MLNEKEFFKRLQQTPQPVVVDFWAPWCGPCRAVEPMVKKLEAEYAGKVEVWKVNADDAPEVLRALRIYGIPTLVAFHGGREVGRRTGVTTPPALSALFEAAISGERPAPAGLAPIQRLLRLLLGTALLVVAFQSRFDGWYLALAGLGAIVAFSAVYDRCPVYRAITAQLRAWLHKDSANPTSAK